jgi:hypothetical protein
MSIDIVGNAERRGRQCIFWYIYLVSKPPACISCVIHRMLCLSTHHFVSNKMIYRFGPKAEILHFCDAFSLAAVQSQVRS